MSVYYESQIDTKIPYLLNKKKRRILIAQVGIPAPNLHVISITVHLQNPLLHKIAEQRHKSTDKTFLSGI